MMVATCTMIYFWCSCLQDGQVHGHYIPKSQRKGSSRLSAQWCLILKTWIKQVGDYFQHKIESLQTRIHHHKGIWKQCITATRYSLYCRTCWHVRKHNYRLLIFSIMACQVITFDVQSGNSSSLHPETFNMDSNPVGINNRCSACMSDNIHDFVG